MRKGWLIWPAFFMCKNLRFVIFLCVLYLLICFNRLCITGDFCTFAIRTAEKNILDLDWKYLKIKLLQRRNKRICLVS